MDFLKDPSLEGSLLDFLNAPSLEASFDGGCFTCRLDDLFLSNDLSWAKRAELESWFAMARVFM